MTKTTEMMREMKRAFVEAATAQGYGGQANNIDAGLRAVLETHVKPLLATAFEHGAVFGRSKQQGIMAAAEEESTRLLASLTEEKHNG